MCERGVLASVCFGLSGIECHERISLVFYEEGLGFQHIHVFLDRYCIFWLGWLGVWKGTATATRIYTICRILLGGRVIANHICSFCLLGLGKGSRIIIASKQFNRGGDGDYFGFASLCVQSLVLISLFLND